MVTHSSILTWRIPWTEEPGRLQSLGHKGSNMTEGLSTAQHVMRMHVGNSFKFLLRVISFI